MTNSIYFAPVLDKLLRQGKINKVPYCQKSERWFPKVGAQCWSYKRNNVFTVVSLDTRSKEAVLRWGCEDDPTYETVTIENIPKVDLVLRDWEFDRSKLLSDLGSVLRICKDHEDETSLRGAEIRMLCALGMLPVLVSIDLEQRFLMNTAKFKVNDYVYYWICDDIQHRSFNLIRDLTKSPRKQNHDVNSGGSEPPVSPDSHEDLTNNDTTSIPPQPQTFTGTRFNDGLIQYILNRNTDRNPSVRRNGLKFFEKICGILQFHKEFPV